MSEITFQSYQELHYHQIVARISVQPMNWDLCQVPKPWRMETTAQAFSFWQGTCVHHVSQRLRVYGIVSEMRRYVKELRPMIWPSELTRWYGSLNTLDSWIIHSVVVNFVDKMYSFRKSMYSYRYNAVGGNWFDFFKYT